MVISLKKEVKRNKNKKTKKESKFSYIKEKFKKIPAIISKKVDIKKIKSQSYIFVMAIPFILIDLITRFLGRNINFYGIIKLAPSLFTLSWIFLFVGLSIFLEKKKGKIFYILIFSIFFILYLVNNIYYSMMNTFFGFNLLQLASEGSAYLVDALIECNIFVYIFAIIIILTFILALKHFKNTNTKTNFINIVKISIIFLIVHFLTPYLLGLPNEDLNWNTWRNPRNIYISFNDSNKSMMVSGIYEYSFRDFYITYLKNKKTPKEEELSFLSSEYDKDEENYSNKYTGKYQDKNLIIIQLEGLDSWLLNEHDTPTLYQMMNNSINFTNHYSYYNGGGSTFNSEFAVNTGFITPLSYTQNAYTFNKNSFPYSLAHLFKASGYSVNAFHMNTSEYYSRGVNYQNWGYDSYNGLKDLGTYQDDSYILDRELILNETFKEKLFGEEKFVDYIIAYSTHLPFSTTKGVCHKLVVEDALKELGVESLPEDYVLKEMSEEDCVRRQAKETDYMVELLLEELKNRNMLENTIITIFTDHYLYTLSDQTIIQNYKGVSNNLINKTPFFIWNNNTETKKITKVTSQLNILPTLLNLFGLEYHPNYYIGQDALDSSYDGFVFFSDYSWYDGNVYTEGGLVTNGQYIEPLNLEEKNNYINYLIQKNDLTLKYDYLKKVADLRNKNT